MDRSDLANEVTLETQPAIQPVEGGSIPVRSLQRYTKRNGLVSVAQIDRTSGAAMIVAGHYSHKNVNTSTIYLGLRVRGELVGVASFGCAMNPLPTCRLVDGTELRNYLELNRLWVSDDVGGNIETVFLGLCWRWLRKERPEVWWVQSFADGRVGVGTIYQAANFTYLGSHKSKFWRDLDTGEVYHNSVLTRKTRKKYHVLMARIDRLRPFTVDTHRYIYFLRPDKAASCVKPAKPYPKTTKESV